MLETLLSLINERPAENEQLQKHKYAGKNGKGNLQQKLRRQKAVKQHKYKQ